MVGPGQQRWYQQKQEQQQERAKEELSADWRMLSLFVVLAGGDFCTLDTGDAGGSSCGRRTKGDWAVFNLLSMDGRGLAGTLRDAWRVTATAGQQSVWADCGYTP